MGRAQIVPCPLFLFNHGHLKGIEMNLYLNGKEYKVELQKVLSQKLYNEVTPLLTKLETSKGARKAFEVELQKVLFTDDYFKGKVNLLKGEAVWDDFKEDVRFIEVVAETMMNIRTNIFECVSIDDETIPIIFDLFKVVLKKNSITHPELQEALDEPTTSEFWQEQDLNAVLDELKFFRSSVLARIKSSA